MHRIVIATIVATFLLTGHSSHGQGVKAWDQPSVAALAHRLLSAVEALYDDVLSHSNMATSHAASRQYHNFKHDLRLVRYGASHLVHALDAGAGFDETARIYERMGPPIRDALTVTSKALIPERAKPKIRAVRDHLISLSEYYGEDLRGDLPRLVD